MTELAWSATREALAETAGRLGPVLAAVSDPAVHAVGDWTVGEVAAHVWVVTQFNTAFATGAPVRAELAAAFERATTATVDDVPAMNDVALTAFPERAPRLLGPAIEEQVVHLLDGTADCDGSEPVTWLGGCTIPVRAVLGHMLSELLVHGTDIARATHQRYPIASDDARLVFEVFLLELLRSDDAVRFAGDRAELMKPATCEVRLRGAEPVVLVVEPDAVSVEPSGRRRVDVRISADPTAMCLVMNGRLSPVRASATGRVVVWGRRPWRLLRLLRALRTP